MWLLISVLGSQFSSEYLLSDPIKEPFVDILPEGQVFLAGFPFRFLVRFALHTVMVENNIRFMESTPGFVLCQC